MVCFIVIVLRILVNHHLGEVNGVMLEVKWLNVISYKLCYKQPFGTIGRMVPYCSILFHIVPYCFKWFHMVPNGSRWFHIVPNGSRWFQVVSGGSRWFRVVPATTGVVDPWVVPPPFRGGTQYHHARGDYYFLSFVLGTT